MTELHQPYPWSYRDLELVVVPITYDREAMERRLPEGFALKEPYKGVLWALHADDIAGVGRYNELMLNIVTTFRGRTATWTPHIFVDNDASMASGREVLGLDKRIAEITVGRFNEQIVVRTKRSGIEVATMGMTLDAEGDADDLAQYERALGYPSLHSVGGRLIEGHLENIVVKRVIHGRGFVDIRPSAADPLHQLGLREVGPAQFVKADYDLVPPRLLDEE